MINPHIVVDPATRRCLCGIYDGLGVTCGDLLANRIPLTHVRIILDKHTVECAEQFIAATPFSVAVNDVATERARQIQAEGYNPEHDDEYDGGTLAAAASCYSMNAACLLHPANGTPMEMDHVAMFGWPWAPEAWKPKDARRDLVRAAALLIAEIERMDRSSGTTPGPTS